MNFGMIILNQSIRAMQSFVMWILTALLFRLKLKIFTKIFQVMLKYCLTHQIIAKMIRTSSKRYKQETNWINER